MKTKLGSTFKSFSFVSLSFLSALLFIGVMSVSFSKSNAEIDDLLQQVSAPTGVVFEIVDWQDDHLSEAIPWVNAQIISLRDKFPALDIAVVSHGSEQFALLTDAQAAYPQIHKQVQSLISDHNIKLELCLGHANMRGFDQSEFPEYVDIEASGPSQIAAYVALGYTRVVVDLD